VHRFFTPLLRRVYFFLVSFLVVYLAVYAAQYSRWNKERLFHNLVSGSRAQKLSAAFDLVWLRGEDQLLRALKSSSPAVREVAVESLWNLWLQAAGKDAFRLAQRANLQMDRKDYDEALTTLTQVVKKYPRFAEGWNRRAVLYWQMGKYEESIADSKRVVGLNPNHYGAWQGMGLCQLHLGHLESACRSLRSALKINPHDSGLQDFLFQCEELLRKLSPDPSGPLHLVSVTRSCDILAARSFADSLA
jgi:tetratricopeptide (TPR) repeat protein